MNARILAALIQKDISLYFKNRFFAFITILGLILFIGVYFLLPKSVNETLPLGWYAPSLPEAFTAQLVEEGLELNLYPSEEALRTAVLDGDEPIGIALPEDFGPQLARGETPRAVLYLKSDLPDELRDAYQLLMEELGFMLTGQPLNIETEEILLGQDMAGQQIPPRQRMLPILVVMILMMETMGLASLISAEIETGTMRALLVTRLNVGGMFFSKGVTGIVMAFSQVLLLLIITNGLQREPVLILVSMLVGALLVTGLSFLIAAASRDLMSVMGWGMLAIIVLAIPSFNILLPGLASNWIKIIPSYYLVDIVHRVINFDAGWRQMGPNLLALTVFSAFFFGLGILSIRRKLR
jgi:ABC-2 type transport system permease protein